VDVAAWWPEYNKSEHAERLKQMQRSDDHVS